MVSGKLQKLGFDPTTATTDMFDIAIAQFFEALWGGPAGFMGRLTPLLASTRAFGFFSPHVIGLNGLSALPSASQRRIAGDLEECCC